MRGIRFAYALSGLLAVVLWSVAATAQQVPIRVERSGASGLITFGWQEPVAFEQNLSGRTLTVRFSSPVQGNFTAIARSLPNIVSAVQAGSDGRSVEMTLRSDAETFAFYSGTSVTVEIVPRGTPDTAAAQTSTAAPAQAPTPPPVPVAAVEQASEQVVAPVPAINASAGGPAGAPRIGVRTGLHPEYTRIVFDFTEEPGFDVVNADGVVTVTFDQAANIDVSGLQSGVRWIGGARAQATAAGSIVTLAVPSSAPVRGFRSGPKVVLDIRQPSGSASPAALPPAATQTAAAPSTERSPAPESQPAEETEVEVATIAPQTTAQQQPPQAPAAPATTDPTAPRVLTPDGSRPPAEDTGGESPFPQAASGQLSQRAQAESGPVTAARATAFPGQDQLAFRFDFDEPTAAATFRRGGAVWIIFDTPTTVDTAALQVAAGEGAFEILQLPNRDATVLRIRTSQRYNPTTLRDGLAWIIDLSPRRLAAQTLLDVNTQPTSPVGPRVFIPVPEPGRPIAVTDPNVGDNFVVVPVIPLGQAIGRDYSYPQFRLQPAAQGIVINPVIDDLRVRSLRQGVEISSSGVQLAISNVSSDAAAHAQLAASRPMVKAMNDLESYFRPVRELQSTRHRFTAEVADAPNATKTAARMQLARFYFANGLAAETLAVLRIAVEAVPLLENDPALRVMRGASNFLLGRYDEALVDLQDVAVDDNDEARLWAAATRAVLGDSLGSARDLRFTGSIARDYPRPLKMRLGLLIAEVSAETGDIQTARLFLEALNLENPNLEEQSRIRFVEGKILELDGDFENAIAAWEEVIESEDRRVRARARVALTEMLLKLRRIELADAIEEYEQLRFAWRGDEMEFANLRRLGTLYLEEGFFREGLSTLKEAATHFRDFANAPEVTQQMSDTFNDLFLGDASDTIDPVKAIAIYNEFKELTPAGARGDEMIRNLADKLVEVDLLERAAGLLAAQVQFRLVGEEKARVGARLALIHTLARNYQNALDVLVGTNEPNLPEELVTQRRHLQARSLIGLDRKQDALALLENDSGENASLLRTEIYWTTANWLDAAQSLRRLVRFSGADPEVPLNDIQAARILSYAVALTNSGGERAIAQLAQEYTFAMEQTKFAEAFRLVTAPSAIGVVDPALVSAKVAEAETFLAAYRDRLKQGQPLSSIN